MNGIDRARLIAIGLCLAGLPAAATAHHSFAMFDYTRSVTLNGVVKDFQWTNPHVAILVYGTQGAAPADSWSVELTSPGNLKRLGWSREQLKPGDKITIEINPLRDGQHGGAFKQATVAATGQVIRAGQMVTKP